MDKYFLFRLGLVFFAFLICYRFRKKKPPK